MTRFKDQVALVTGASSGIGTAIVLALAAEGATVCLVGRNRAGLDTVAERARDLGPAAHVWRLDLEHENEIRDVAKAIERDVGRLHALIHAAGLIAPSPLRRGRLDAFDAQYRVNVRAPWALTQAVLPMLRAERGQIVFLNSTVGLHATGGVSQYAATKHALRAIADAIREEVNADGVRVLSVYVGRTATPMQAALHALEGKPYRPERLIQPDDVASVVRHALALPPTVEVTDMTLRPLLKPA
ncbi:MAG: SDR family NAD(P)-dependent oxidoreductase [Candidatus Rokubacteria bacterium]|nr:SDR family NAD(P)-dependent oxidoreductase [Candidatus Rokubacteria bacterium]